MTEIEKYKDKGVWHRIIARDIEASGETFDQLNILAIYTDSNKGKKYLIVNYMTEEGIGSYRTSFGNVKTKFEDLESLFREEAINQILDR